MAARHPLARRARTALARWQRTLPRATRASLRATTWPDPPIALVGIPVDPETARENTEWTAQLREYVTNHDDVSFFLHEHVGGICRAHARARQVIATGVIPVRFACPRGERACPFATASALVPGKAIVLVDALRRRAPHRARLE